jgi:nucleoside-diphosphate-sugar epimerase
MRTLITGATSNLGISLARNLIARRDEVHAVVRETSDTAALDALGAKVHVLDGRQSRASALREIVGLADPDVVFHLATHYVRRHVADDVARIIDANITFGVELVSALIELGRGALVSAGSFFQFAGPDHSQPLNLYAAAKSAFDSVVAELASFHGFDTVSLVLYDLYGEGDHRRRFLRVAVESAMTGTPMYVVGGAPPLDLVHVEDAAAAFVRAADLLLVSPDLVRSRRFAVSSGERHSLEDLVRRVGSLAGRRVDVSFMDGSTTHVPGEPSLVPPWSGPPVPGWTPSIPLDEGIRRMLANALDVSFENRDNVLAR